VGVAQGIDQHHLLPGLGETDRQARSGRSGAGDENRHRFSALESSGLDRADG